MMRRVLNYWHEPVIRDRLVAFSFIVVGQIELISQIDSPTGPRFAVAAADLLLGLMLLWRRTAPLFSSAAITTIIFASSIAWQLPDSIVSPGAVLFFSGFALAAYAPTSRAIAGMGYVFVAAVISAIVKGEPIGDNAFIFSVYAVVWGAGRLVRSRAALAAQLADRAAVLEHQRDERAAEAAANERARIARELHDVVAHCVNVIVLQAGGERRLVERERPETAAVLREIEATGREALSELRRMLGVVHSGDAAPLEPQPRLADLPALIERSESSGLDASLAVNGDPRPLPAGLELSAYRIVQESLTNVIKHAPGAQTAVELEYRPDSLEVVVTNSAPAAHAERDASGSSRGLIGIRERVELFSGTVRAGATRDGGFSVRARFPVESTA